MSFEEEFDRKINQKMDEASFPFDEANWAKASAMLDVERKVDGGGFSKIYVPLVAIGLVSLSLVALSYFNTTNETLTGITQSKNLVNTSLNTPIQKEQPTIGKELNLTNTSDQPALTVVAETPAKAADAKTTMLKPLQLNQNYSRKNVSRNLN